MARKRRRAVVCPHCGWDARKDSLHDHVFRHLEEVTTERRVVGVNEHGVLVIEAEERIVLEDPGANQRLQCGDRLAEFPLPDLRVDFV